MMRESPEHRATRFAERLARDSARVLGDQFVAAFLHGSLTMGDFVPGQSDIDLLIVVERALSDDAINTLQGAVGALAAQAPSRVDLRVVTRDVAASPTPTPAMEAYFAVSPGRPVSVETGVAAELDLAVEFSMVRAHGRSLIGPDAAAVVGPVPGEWVVVIGDRQMAAWEQLTNDEAHDVLMVLTTCRIWRFHAEGVHCSKTEAGRWALARDPTLTAVAEALRKRGGAVAATIEPGGIQRLLAIVRRDVVDE